MSAEDNKATNRRFYEEAINQKHLAVLDEIASDSSSTGYGSFRRRQADGALGWP